MSLSNKHLHFFEHAPELRFSVVIAHRGDTALLGRTLQALSLAADAMRDEVWVVDNGSDNASLLELERDYSWIKLIANGCNTGFAHANNQALRLSRGRYLLLLNNDALVAPDLLDQLADLFAQAPAVGAIGAQLTDADGRHQRSSGLVPRPIDELALKFVRRRWRDPQGEGLHDVESLVGAALAVRRAAVEVIGALDEDFFFYFEDTEWCHRLRAGGWRVCLAPGVHVVHERGASTKPVYVGAQIEMLRSRLLFYRKVFPPMISKLLIGYRFVRLTANTLVLGLGAVLTLGQVPGIRKKAKIYAVSQLWFLLGCPASWGLPDKCPKTHRGEERG